MNIKGIKEAAEVCSRFLLLAKRYEILLESQANDKWSSMNPKESGAVRRASMDLTRALAEMRRPN